jgi:hypothetical protein
MPKATDERALLVGAAPFENFANRNIDSFEEIS